MAQVGKNVNWTPNATAREMSEVVRRSGALVNVSWLNNNDANMFGEDIEYAKYKTAAEAAGFVITDSDIPIPPQPPADTPPTQEELDNIQFQKEAYDEEITAERDTFWAKVQANYVVKGGTGTALKNGRYY